VLTSLVTWLFFVVVLNWHLIILCSGAPSEAGSIYVILTVGPRKPGIV